MNQKDKLSPKYIIYFISALLILLLFIFQHKFSFDPNFPLLMIFIMVFFFVAELLGTRGGAIAGLILVITILIKAFFAEVSVQPKHYLTSFLLVILIVYYYLIKMLRKGRLEETTAREKYFRTLANITLQPMLLLDAKGEVLFVSESIKDILGSKNNLSIGTKITDYVHPEDVELYNRFLKLVLSAPNEKKITELRFKKNLDGWIWIKSDAINLLKNSSIHAIVSSIQDITFQKNIDLQKSELLENETKARALSEKAVRDRDEFLSIASHELKTPLTTVLLQLQATLRKISTQSLADFSGTELLNSLQIAETQSKNLANLIKDLLNVSLASTGRLSLNQQKANLGDLAESLVKKYNEEIKLSGCVVELVNEDQNIIGNWDPVRIEQATTNVFLNAIKYAKGKKVTILTKRENDSGIFIVKDTGPGISEELLAEIFEPFNNSSNDPTVKGLGVGLFITKQIVLAHKGEIKVESKLGKGTKITIKLPLVS